MFTRAEIEALEQAKAVYIDYIATVKPGLFAPKMNSGLCNFLVYTYIGADINIILGKVQEYVPLYRASLGFDYDDFISTTPNAIPIERHDERLQALQSRVDFIDYLLNQTLPDEN